MVVGRLTKHTILDWLRRPRQPTADPRPVNTDGFGQDIANADLRVEELPPIDSEWNLSALDKDADLALVRFAATFNAYRYWDSVEQGSLLRAIRQGDKRLEALTLTELRTWLFFRYRAICHDDGYVTPDDNAWARAVLEQIHDRVTRGAIE
jgi:hypothetical protein